MNREKLKELFRTDIEFTDSYSKYHPEVKNDLDSIVEDNWNKIKELDTYETEYGYFSVDRKSDIIPWVVGFFVKPEYRKNNQLVSDIKRETNSLFLCCISNNNTKALNFLNKFCKIKEKDEMKTIYYYMRGL